MNPPHLTIDDCETQALRSSQLNIQYQLDCTYTCIDTQTLFINNLKTIINFYYDMIEDRQAPP